MSQVQARRAQSARPLLVMAAPAAALMAAVLVLLVASGVHPGDAILAVAYQLGYVIVPGVLAYWAISGRLGLELRDLVCGWSLGYVLEILAFVGTAAAGQRSLFLVYPALASALAAGVVIRRRTRSGGRVGLAAPPDALLTWGAAAIAVLALVYVGLAHFTLTPLPSPGRDVVYHPDFPFHISIAAEAKHHWPILDSQVAGEPRVYHVFSHIDMAAMSRVTGIDLPVVYFRLYLIPLIVLFVLGLVAAGKSMTGNAWVGIVAAALVVLVAELDLDPRAFPAADPFGVTFFTYLVDGPSFLFGLVFFLPLCLLLHDRLVSPTSPGRWRDWLLIALLLVGCCGAKVSAGPVILGGLVIFVAWDRLASGRFNRPALLAGLIVLVVMGMFYLLQYRGHSSGSSIDPFASTDEMTGVNLAKLWLAGAPGPLGSDVVLDAVGALLGLVALLIAPLVGLALLVGRRLNTRQRWLAALFLSGLAQYLLIHPNSGYSLFYGYAAGALLSAEALVALASRQRIARARSAAVGRVALAWAGFLALLIALPLALGGNPGDPGFVVTATETARANGELFVGWYTALGLGLVALYLIARRRPVAGLGASLVVVGAILMVGALDVPLDNAVRLAGGGRASDGRPSTPGMTRGLYEGLIWVRSHTTPNEVLAVNSHLSAEPGRRSGSYWYFYYSAFSERRVFLEDWAFAAKTLDVGGDDPFPERVALNEAVFDRGDPWSLLALADSQDVTTLLVDKHQKVGLSGHLGRRSHAVFSNRDVAVYSIAPRSRVLSTRDGEAAIRSPSGERIPVAAGAVGGAVETIAVEEGRVRVSGWSADAQGPADQVLVFIDGRLAAPAVPSTDRADVAEAIGPKARLSGFSALAAAPLGSPEPRPADVRVYAIRAGRATRLGLIGATS